MMFHIPPKAAPKVLRVSDNSTENSTRAVIVFKNGHSLSIIRDPDSMGGTQGLFEIAPIDPNGSVTGDLFDKADRCFGVLGWCDLNKINHYILKIADIPEGISVV